VSFKKFPIYIKLTSPDTLYCALNYVANGRFKFFVLGCFTLCNMKL